MEYPRTIAQLEDLIEQGRITNRERMVTILFEIIGNPMQYLKQDQPDYIPRWHGHAVTNIYLSMSPALNRLMETLWFRDYEIESVLYYRSVSEDRDYISKYNSFIDMIDSRSANKSHQTFMEIFGDQVYLVTIDKEDRIPTISKAIHQLEIVLTDSESPNIKIVLVFILDLLGYVSHVNLCYNDLGPSNINFTLAEISVGMLWLILGRLNFRIGREIDLSPQEYFFTVRKKMNYEPIDINTLNQSRSTIDNWSINCDSSILYDLMGHKKINISIANHDYYFYCPRVNESNKIILKKVFGDQDEPNVQFIDKTGQLSLLGIIHPAT